MTVIAFLLLLVGIGLLIGLVALVGPAVVRYVSEAGRTDRRELRETKTREMIATKALRSIANGAGNPLFEAQDALDAIERTYPKELN